MVVWGGLTNNWEKKRSEKQKKKKREREIYPFECRVPKLARRDKKAFLSDQCKEIEENNRMGKTRDLFKKALGWPRGMGWGVRWEEGSGWGIHVNPWLIHVNVWQKPLQYCKLISLQLK